MSKKRDKIGSHWRILAHGALANVSTASNGQAVFDELVIDGVLHVEQMATNHWWFNAGNLHVDVVVKRGKPVVTWWEDKVAGKSEKRKKERK